MLQVAWIHIDRQMILTIHRHVIARLPRFSVSFDNQKTWLLHVSGVQQEDRGYYMCQVNTNPMISQVGYLQVVGKHFTEFYDFWKQLFTRWFIHSFFFNLENSLSQHIIKKYLVFATQRRKFASLQAVRNQYAGRVWKCY